MSLFKKMKADALPKSSPIKKFVRVKLVQITLLRVEKNFFEAKFALRLTWSQTKKDTISLSENLQETQDYWNPKITITNYFGDLITYSNLEVDVSSNWQPYFIETKFFHGSFLNDLYFEYFPFDVQSLTLMVQSERSSDEVELVFERRSYIAKGTYQAVKHQGLILKKVYEMSELTEADITYPGHRENAKKIKVFIRRQSIKPIILDISMLVLCLISVSTLCLDPTIFQNSRIVISLLSSWSIFALNFSAFLPSCPSTLNKQNVYFLLLFCASLFVCCCNSFGHSLITYLGNLHENNHLFDATVPMVVAPVLIFAVLFLVYIASFKVFIVWRSFDMKVKQTLHF